jgi:hypothetical protein
MAQFRTLGNGPIYEVATTPIAPSEIADQLLVTITSLDSNKPRTEFKKDIYRPRYSGITHPFDIDYRNNGTYDSKKYLEVTIEIDPSISQNVRFVPPNPAEKIVHGALTCVEGLAQVMIFNLEDPEPGNLIKFYIKQLDIPFSINPKIAASYNLNFRFTDSVFPDQYHYVTHDPQVPNDGS